MNSTPNRSRLDDPMFGSPNPNRTNGSSGNRAYGNNTNVPSTSSKSQGTGTGGLGQQKDEFKPVSSSNLKAVAYNPETRIMKIQFRSGSEYAYYGIERGVYTALMGSGSKGRHHHYYIKWNYTFKRIK